jgi:hypothetical protein
MIQKDDFVYLECDLNSKVYDGDKQLGGSWEYYRSFEFKEFYRFSEAKNEIGHWRIEYNQYQTQCDSYKCNVGKEVVEWGRSVDPDGYTSWSKQINRMTGVFTGESRVNSNRSDGTIVLISGVCTKGQSKVSGTRKF